VAGIPAVPATRPTTEAIRTSEPAAALSTATPTVTRVSSNAAHRMRPVLELKEAQEGLIHEVKRLPKPFQAQNTDEKGNFEGHLAVFNDPHPTSSWRLPMDWMDRIMPGAFTRTLAEHKKRGTMPSLLYMHERGNVVGAWKSLEEDQDGLKAFGQVSLNAYAPSGATIHELMRMGGITGLSIGFVARKVTLDEKAKMRDILDVDLDEGSIVDIPAGPRARITDVKTGGPRVKQVLEAVLRDAGLSRREAKALLAGGFAALRDAGAEDESEQRDADPAPQDEAKQSDIAGLIRDLAATIRA
jgi:HK97 family phage prohead protease